MAKMHRIVLYVIDHADQHISPAAVIDEIRNHRHGYLGEVVVKGQHDGTVDIGPWHDDHPLNKLDSEPEDYFGSCIWDVIDDLEFMPECEGSDSFHLTPGLDLPEFCQHCGKRIEVCDPDA